MEGVLDGRVAIVTGARGSIGLAIASLFAQEGARVVCLELTEEGAHEAATRADPQLTRTLPVRCDVTDEASVRSAVQTTVDAFGGLDILVNSAAAGHVPVERAAVDQLARDDWDTILSVNLTGSFLMSKHAVAHMIGNGGGAIVHLASQLGHVGSRGRAAYCVSKAGLIQLTKVMALEYAEHGIRVNSLSPGAVAGDRAVRHYGSLDRAQEVLTPKHPVGRLGEPVEIAQAALLTVDPRCSFMTGSDVLVDGGYCAQ